MYFYTQLTINRCSEDGTKLATLETDGLFKQTFEINTITFERAMECVSHITHRYRPCQVTRLFTTLKGGNKDVRTDDSFQS